MMHQQYSHFQGRRRSAGGMLPNNANSSSNSGGGGGGSGSGTPTSGSTSAAKQLLTIKRSEEAPITLQGWLFKQGSEGLMLWKKRWFVLSEFCLFYYKVTTAAAPNLRACQTRHK